MKEDGLVNPHRLRIIRCFQASAVYYDEWTGAKGKDTEIIKVLNDICASKNGKQRPLVSLSSGTPMPQGPKDLVGVLLLISWKRTLPRQSFSIAAAYQAAYKSMGGMAEVVDQSPPLVLAWRRIRNDGLSGCVFDRCFVVKFLDGTLHDPRPGLLRYPEKYCKSDEQRVAKLERMKQALWKVIESTRRRDGTVAMPKLPKTREFQTILHSDVMPGIAALPGDEWMATPWPPSTPGNTLIFSHEVRQQYEGKVALGLAMMLYPLNAAMVASWLARQMGDAVHVAETTSKLKPTKRRKLVKGLQERATQQPEQPIVVDSTYTILSTGIDSLQTFASYLVTLEQQV